MKIIQGLFKTGQKIWILVPDVSVYSFIKRGKISYLDIFYSFAQLAIGSGSKKEIFKHTSIDLENRVKQIFFWSKELKGIEKRLLSRKLKRRIKNFDTEQAFLALIGAYLNNLHSIYDLVKTIDGMLKNNFRDKFFTNKDWFKREMSIRTLFHHIEVPLIITEKGRLILHFERIDKLKGKQYKKYLKGLTGGKAKIQFEVTCHDMGDEVLKALNLWALEHLKKIDKNKTLPSIYGFYLDGRHRTKQIMLKDLMKIAGKS